MGTNPKSRLGRRRFMKITGSAAGIGALAGCSGDVASEGEDNFPQQDMRLVIPFGPGGGYDEYSRLTAPYVEENLDGDHNINPQNVEGSGGNVAAEEVYNAEPDGYTQIILNTTNFGLSQLIEDVNFDLQEFTILAQVAEEFRSIAVGANTDIETWDQFVQAVQNEELNIASTGPGSGYVTVPGAIGAVEDLYTADKIMDNQVVYGGRGEAVQGILAGDAHVLAGSHSSIVEYTQSGDLRMILVGSAEDQPPEETPNAETFSSLGMDTERLQAMLNSRRVFAAPPDMDDNRTETLREAYSAAIQDEDLQAEAEEIDRPITYSDAESTQENIDTFLSTWEENRETLEKLYAVDE